MSNSFFRVNKGINLKPQTSAPTSPDTGDVYFDNTQNTLMQYANGAWSPVGSSSTVEYIPAAVSSGASIGSFTTYTDAAGSAPVDGTGTTTTDLSITSTVGTDMLGSNFLTLAKTSGTNTQGKGLGLNFSIDSALKGKMVTISFMYKLLTGTFTAGNPNDRTSAGDSDLTVWIYDVTNATIIQPTNYRLYSNSTTLADTFSGSFQTASNSTSYRLILHSGTTSTSNFSMAIDQLSVSPVNSVAGPIITDLQDYSITIGGSTTAPTLGTHTKKASYKQIGDYAYIKFELSQTSAGSAGSGTYLFPLPPGLSIDSSKLSVGVSGGQVSLGSATGNNGTNLASGFVSSFNSTNLQIYLGNQTDATSVVGSTFYSAGNPTYRLGFEAMVPIQGWSSNVTLSSSSSNRQTVFVGYKSSGQAVTANVTDIAYVTQRDSSGTWNGTQFVAQEPGDYFLSIGGSASAATWINVYVGGSLYKAVTDFNSTTNVSGSLIVYGVLAGQTISVRAGSSVTINGGASTNPYNLSIYKLANPQTIAQNEDIYAVYTDTSGATLQTSQTVFKYTTKVRDTHSAYNTATGIFTAPATGLYRISYTLASSGSSSLATSQRLASYIVVNGSGVTATKMNGNGVATSLFTTQSVEYPLLAGQTIQIQAAIDVSQAALSTAGFNILSITRVGNY